MHLKFKLNFKEALPIKTVIVLMALIFCFSYAQFEGPGSNPWTNSPETSTFRIMNSLPPIDPELPVDIPYYRYARLQDSTRYIRDLKNGDLPAGVSTFSGIVGFYTALHCDTCSYPARLPSERGKRQKYLMLAGWKLNTVDRAVLLPNELTYFVKNEHSYVRKTKLVSVDTMRNGLVNYNSIAVDVPVKFNYSRRNQSILIPITDSKIYAEILAYGTTIIILVWMLSIFYFFLRFIIDVSKGSMFMDRNLWALRFIGWSILCYPIAMVLLNLMLRLAFNSYFIEEVEMNGEIWASWRYHLIIGLVFLLISSAFKRGKRLQEEADLTV